MKKLVPGLRALILFVLLAAIPGPSFAQVYPQSPLDLSENSAFPERKKDKAVILHTEQEVADARWSLANTENEEIFCAYYIVDGDKLGPAEFAAARAAARRGAKVYILMDAFSIFQYLHGAVYPALVKALIDDPASEGRTQVRIFNRASATNRFDLLKPWKLFRMHDKLMYLKSYDTLFTGDRNAQNINFRLRKNWEIPNIPWEKRVSHKGISYRSVETMVQGQSARDARSYLWDLWQVSQEFDFKGVTPQQVAHEVRRMDLMEKAMAIKKIEPDKWLSMLKEVESVKFVHDVVDAKGRYFNQEREFVRMIDSAHESITIVTPYANLPQIYLDAIDRALARGEVKDITIITAGLISTDSPMSTLAFARQAKKLRAKGVRIYIHHGPDLMHTKLLNVDSLVTFIGSYNFNNRSLKMDMESGVIIKDKKYGQDARRFIEKLANECKPFAPFEKTFDRCASLLVGAGNAIPFVGDQY